MKREKKVKVRVHREWFMALARTTCDCGAKKTTVYSWGEHVNGKWRTVQYCCAACLPTVIGPMLIEHAKDCGCTFEIVGRNISPTPEMIAIETKINSMAQACSV